ncbi:MAG TPA: hypothetical protein VNA20_00840 [Frankiaceae bacterium]|nr:hypothetical protein [Frankiaceae bacterium]
MLRTVAAALVAAALAVPAHADPPNDTQFTGGCRFRAVGVSAPQPPEWPDTYVAIVSAAVVAMSPTPEHNPATLTALRCLLLVNGTTVFSASGTTAGPVGVVPPTPLTVTVADTDVVEFCTEATAVDTHGQQVQLVCGPHGDPDLTLIVDFVNDLVFGGVVDPAVCPTLASLAPTQVQNHLRIDEQGDVYLAGELWWDCPPYAF